MRAYEIELLEVRKGDKRIPKISLRWLNQTKKHEAVRQASFDARDKFLPIMYGKGDPIEDELKQIELEKERLELARLKLEFEEFQNSISPKTEKAIKRMSRSYMRRKKKAHIL